MSCKKPSAYERRQIKKIHERIRACQKQVQKEQKIDQCRRRDKSQNNEIRMMTCGRKIRYESEGTAQIVMIMRGTKEHLRAYRCPYCGGWHITHKPEARPKKNPEEKEEKHA